LNFDQPAVDCFSAGKALIGYGLRTQVATMEQEVNESLLPSASKSLKSTAY
jgi:hypothetical protein